MKAERLATQADAFERQQAELDHLQRFVDRFRYGTKARQAQSKLKAMARIERIDRPTGQRTLGFRFPVPKRSGRIVIEAEGLDVGVAGRTLVKGADFAIERGQRVALIGPNGAGKTTLIETLLGHREPIAGKIRLGHGTEPGYYSQQSLELPDAYRALDAITSGTGLTGPAARDLLGLFLFSGEDVEKPVSALSGGERRRLALARTVVSGANFLVLDEPTNHLDIESREALEDALLGFPGTLLLVSHDRALIEALATRTLAIDDRRLVAREGAFGDYARATEAARPREAAAAANPKPAKGAKPKAAAPAKARRPQPASRPARRPSQRAAREARRLEARDRRGRGAPRRDRGPALPAGWVRRRRGAGRRRHASTSGSRRRSPTSTASGSATPPSQLARRDRRREAGELLVAPGELAGAQVCGDHVHPGQLGGDHRALILRLDQGHPGQVPVLASSRSSSATRSRSAAARCSSSTSRSPGPSSIANESAAGNRGNSLRGDASMSSSHSRPWRRPSSVSS